MIQQVIYNTFTNQDQFIDKLKQLIDKKPMIMHVTPVRNVHDSNTVLNLKNKARISLNYQKCGILYDNILGFNILVDAGDLIKYTFYNLGITEDVKKDINRIMKNTEDIKKVLGEIPAVEQLEISINKLRETIRTRFDSSNYEYKEGDLTIKKHD